MTHSKTLRALLFLSGLLATAIGAGLLFTPLSFHAANGIHVDADASLLSELRAPGGVLLLAGVGMLGGAFARSLTRAATIAGAAVFSTYGLARLVGLALDGTPGAGILAAAAIELVLGSLFVLTLVRWPGARPATEAA